MEEKRQIINIVNFIRGYNSEWQPFGETYHTVKNQIELIDKYNFKATGECKVSFDDIEFYLSEDRMTIASPMDIEIENLIGVTNEFSPTIKNVGNKRIELS